MSAASHHDACIHPPQLLNKNKTRVNKCMLPELHLPTCSLQDEKSKKNVRTKNKNKLFKVFDMKIQ